MLKFGFDTIVPVGIRAAYVGMDLVFFKLPAGYTKCNYVRSNANAYFTTGLYLTSESEVISDVQYEGSAGNTYGCYTSSSASDNFCLYAGASGSDAYIRYDGSVERSFRATSGTRYKLVHGKNGFWANGTQYASAWTSSAFTCSNPFVVGNLSNSTAAKFKGRIYRMTVNDNGQVKLDLIPCQHNSAYGLYDMIGKTFYASEGTAFSGG